MLSRVWAQLSSVRSAWIAAALLPLPAALLIEASANAEVTCVYLGLASAGLAAWMVHRGGLAESRVEVRARVAAICVAVLVDALLVYGLARAVGIRSTMAFAWMSGLAVVPALGLVPWLTLRLRSPFRALVAAAFVLLVAKLTGCAVARIVYGPNFAADGRIAADWRTAKLMITVCWALVGASSIAGCVAMWAGERDRR